MYDRILVPTDGGNVAITAANEAFALARRFGADLHAVHALDTGDAAYGQQLVAAIEDVAGELDIETTTAVVGVDDSVHRSILDYAAEHDVDCIVMGTHGEQKVRRLVLGSVAARTLRESPIPVVTVHGDTVVESDIETVLVPTDGSRYANAAAEHAIAFAVATDAAIHAIHVVNPDDVPNDDGTVLDALETAGKRAIDEVIERAQDAGVSSVEASVLSGIPHQAIDDYVRDHDVDYVFVGTHGRTGVSRYVLGSVTERVVRLVDVPVVSVKPPEQPE